MATSERKSQEEIVIQANYKIAEAILQSRIRFEPGSIGKLQRERPFFNLGVEKIDLVRDRLEVVKNDLSTPFCVNIFWRPPPSANDQRRRTLLESWSVHFAPDTADHPRIGDPDTETVVLKRMYTKLAVFLRSLCIYVRLLPCCKIFRDVHDVSVQCLEFELLVGHHQTRETQSLSDLKNSPTCDTYVFPAVDTPVGSLTVSVSYLKETAHIIALQQQHESPSIAIIKNYVPEPATSVNGQPGQVSQDEEKSLASEATNPSSSYPSSTAANASESGLSKLLRGSSVQPRGPREDHPESATGSPAQTSLRWQRWTPKALSKSPGSPGPASQLPLTRATSTPRAIPTRDGRTYGNAQKAKPPQPFRAATVDVLDLDRDGYKSRSMPVSTGVFRPPSSAVPINPSPPASRDGRAPPTSSSRSPSSTTPSLSTTPPASAVAPFASSTTPPTSSTITPPPASPATPPPASPSSTPVFPPSAQTSDMGNLAPASSIPDALLSDEEDEDTQQGGAAHRPTLLGLLQRDGNGHATAGGPPPTTEGLKRSTIGGVVSKDTTGTVVRHRIPPNANDTHHPLPGGMHHPQPGVATRLPSRHNSLPGPSDLATEARGGGGGGMLYYGAGVHQQPSLTGVPRPRSSSHFVPLPSGTMLFSPASLTELGSHISTGTTPPNAGASISPLPLFGTSGNSSTTSGRAMAGNSLTNMMTPGGESLSSSPLIRPMSGLTMGPGGSSISSLTRGGGAAYSQTMARNMSVSRSRRSSSSAFSISPFKEQSSLTSSSLLVAKTYGGGATSSDYSPPFAPTQAGHVEPSSAPPSQQQAGPVGSSGSAHLVRRKSSSAEIVTSYIHSTFKLTRKLDILPWNINLEDLVDEELVPYADDDDDEEDGFPFGVGDDEDGDQHYKTQDLLARKCDHAPDLEIFAQGATETVSGNLCTVKDLEKQLDTLMLQIQTGATPPL